ncbi:MAG: fibronectin type III domain-containing protein, partial [Clostridiales bacterium]|nr:fibronectin type III domain-containing protein [Clostridiales bacterium]
MKKLLSIMMSLVIAASMFSFATPIFATENKKSTAYTLTLGEQSSVTYEYSSYDFSMWFKFTAPSNAWYQFEAVNPYLDGTYITLYNSSGDEIDFGYVDDFTEQCIAYGDLSANSTYYLEVDCAYPLYNDADYTLKLLASKHTHDYKLDYTYTYSDYTEASYTCRGCGKSKSSKLYAPKKVTLSYTSTKYNGKSKKPTVKVTDSKGNTIGSQYYSVTYSNNKKVGKATVKVKFKGDYSSFSSISKTFKIVPQSTSISKITAKSKGFTVKWKKQSTQTTGYQIQYGTKKDFSNAKTVTVSKNSTTSKTISSLKSKKKYYVRVRTYKTVDGKKYYSSWSKS